MTIEFTITNRKGETFKCLIDDEDADLLSLSWHTRTTKSTSYVMHGIKHATPSTILMHRVILGRVLGRPLTPEEIVDHKDLNGSNNTRGNLRLTTHAGNITNRALQKNNTTGYKGVYKHKGRYEASVYINSKRKYLGRFDTPEEAHAAYIAAAIKYYGEFARGE